eukprot:gnl/MRDRNA2_/MRDRNA2_85824_c0_seq1.p1 gnl/MRDRNA2_/MRDRNA2_85824_c0~~gnl/MRDRNA2_/MRDRNA2_85824_c0_seq1.p1  ORF type:complete len:3517 (+),score=755.69 gnl/MRDRNA2_/MRDRNA2_85824_c0_seq1:167-10552(+)
MLQNGHAAVHHDANHKDLGEVPHPESFVTDWDHKTGYRTKVRASSAKTQKTQGVAAKKEVFGASRFHSSAASSSKGFCSSNSASSRSGLPSKSTVIPDNDETTETTETRRPHRPHHREAVAPTNTVAGSYAPYRGPERKKLPLPITANLGFDLATDVELPKDENIGTLREVLMSCRRILWAIEGPRKAGDLSETLDGAGGELGDSPGLLAYTEEEAKEMRALRQALKTTVKQGVRLNREHIIEMNNLERKMRKHGQAQVQLLGQENSLALEERCFLVQLKQSKLTAEAAVAARSLNAFKILGEFYQIIEDRGRGVVTHKKPGKGIQDSAVDENGAPNPELDDATVETADGRKQENEIDVSQTARELRRQIEVVEARRAEAQRQKRERNLAEQERITTNTKGEGVDVMDSEMKHRAKADELKNKGDEVNAAVSASTIAAQKKFRRLLDFIDQGQTSVTKLLVDMKSLSKREQELVAAVQRELEPEVITKVLSTMRGDGGVAKETMDKLKEQMKAQGGADGVNEKQALTRRRDRFLELLEEREKKSDLELKLEKELAALREEEGESSEAPLDKLGRMQKRMTEMGAGKPGLQYMDKKDIVNQPEREKQRESLKKAVSLTMQVSKVVPKPHPESGYPSADESNKQLSELRTAIGKYATRANEFKSDIESAMPEKKAQLDELIEGLEEMKEATGGVHKVTKTGKKNDPTVPFDQVVDKIQTWADMCEKVHQAMKAITEIKEDEVEASKETNTSKQKKKDEKRKDSGDTQKPQKGQNDGKSASADSQATSPAVADGNTPKTPGKASVSLGSGKKKGATQSAPKESIKEVKKEEGKQAQPQVQSDDKDKKTKNTKNPEDSQQNDAQILKWRMQNESTKQKTVALQSDIEQLKQAIEDQNELDVTLSKQAEDLKNSIELLRQQHNEVSLNKKAADAKKKSKGKDSVNVGKKVKDLKKQIAKQEKELKAAEQKKAKAEATAQDINHAYFKVSQTVTDARKRLAEAQAECNSQQDTAEEPEDQPSDPKSPNRSGHKKGGKSESKDSSSGGSPNHGGKAGGSNFKTAGGGRNSDAPANLGGMSGGSDMKFQEKQRGSAWIPGGHKALDQSNSVAYLGQDQYQDPNVNGFTGRGSGGMHFAGSTHVKEPDPWEVEFPDDTSAVAKEKFDICNGLKVSKEDLGKKGKRRKLRMIAVQNVKRARRILHLRQKLLMSFLSETDRQDLQMVSQQEASLKGASKFAVEYDRLKERHQMLSKLIEFWTRRIAIMEKELSEKKEHQHAENAIVEEEEVDLDEEEGKRPNKRDSSQYISGTSADSNHQNMENIKASDPHGASIPARVTEKRGSAAWSYLAVVEGELVSVPTISVHSHARTKQRNSLIDAHSLTDHDPESRRLAQDNVTDGKRMTRRFTRTIFPASGVMDGGMDPSQLRRFSTASRDINFLDYPEGPLSQKRSTLQHGATHEPDLSLDFSHQRRFSEKPVGWESRRGSGRRGSGFGMLDKNNNQSGAAERAANFVRDMQHSFKDYAARRPVFGASALSSRPGKKSLSELMMAVIGGNAESYFRMQLKRLFDLPSDERYYALQELLNLERRRIAFLTSDGFTDDCPEVQAADRVLNILISSMTKSQSTGAVGARVSHANWQMGRRNSQGSIPQIHGQRIDASTEEKEQSDDAVIDFGANICNMVAGILTKRRSSISDATKKRASLQLNQGQIVDHIMSRSLKTAQLEQAKAKQQKKTKRTSRPIRDAFQTKSSSSSEDSGFGSLDSDSDTDSNKSAEPSIEVTSGSEQPCSSTLENHDEVKDTAEDEKAGSSAAKAMLTLGNAQKKPKVMTRKRGSLNSLGASVTVGNLNRIKQFEQDVGHMDEAFVVNGDSVRRGSAPGEIMSASAPELDSLHAVSTGKQSKKKKVRKSPLIAGKEIGQEGWLRRGSRELVWSEVMDKEWSQAQEAVRQAKIQQHEQWQQNVKKMHLEMSSGSHRGSLEALKTLQKEGVKQDIAAKFGSALSPPAPKQPRTMLNEVGENNQTRWLNIRRELRTLIDTAKKDKEMTERGWDTGRSSASVNGLDQEMQNAIGKMVRTVNQDAKRALRNTRPLKSSGGANVRRQRSGSVSYGNGTAMSAQEMANRREARIRERLERGRSKGALGGETKGDEARLAARRLDEIMYEALDETPQSGRRNSEVDVLFSLVDDLRMSTLLRRASAGAEPEGKKRRSRLAKGAQDDEPAQDSKGSALAKSPMGKFLPRSRRSSVPDNLSETDKQIHRLSRSSNLHLGKVVPEKLKETKEKRRAAIGKDGSGGVFEKRRRDRAALAATTHRRGSRDLGKLNLGNVAKGQDDSATTSTEGKKVNRRVNGKVPKNGVPNSSKERLLPRSKMSIEGDEMALQALTREAAGQLEGSGAVAEASGSDADSDYESSDSDTVVSSEELDEVPEMISFNSNSFVPPGAGRRNSTGGSGFASMRRGGVQGPLDGVLAWVDMELRQRLPDGGAFLEEKLGVTLSQVVQAAILADIGYYESLLERPREEFAEAMCRMVTSMQDHVQTGHFEVGGLADDNALNTLLQVNWHKNSAPSREDARDQRRRSIAAQVPLSGQQRRQSLTFSMGASDTGLSSPLPTARRRSLVAGSESPSPSSEGLRKRRHTLSHTLAMGAVDMQQLKTDSGSDSDVEFKHSAGWKKDLQSGRRHTHISLPVNGNRVDNCRSNSPASPESPSAVLHTSGNSSPDEEEDRERNDLAQSDVDKGNCPRSKSGDGSHKQHVMSQELTLPVKSSKIGAMDMEAVRPFSTNSHNSPGFSGATERLRKGSVVRRGSALPGRYMSDSGSAPFRRSSSENMLQVFGILEDINRSSDKKVTQGSKSLSPPPARDRAVSVDLLGMYQRHVVKPDGQWRQRHSASDPHESQGPIVTATRTNAQRLKLPIQSKTNSPSRSRSPCNVISANLLSDQCGLASQVPRAASASPLGSKRHRKGDEMQQGDSPPSSAESSSTDHVPSGRPRNMTSMRDRKKKRALGTIVRAETRAWKVSPEALQDLSISEIHEQLQQNLMMFRRAGSTPQGEETPPTHVPKPDHSPSGMVPEPVLNGDSVAEMSSSAPAFHTALGPIVGPPSQRGLHLSTGKKLPPLEVEPTVDQNVVAPEEIVTEVPAGYLIPDSLESLRMDRGTRKSDVRKSLASLRADHVSSKSDRGISIPPDETPNTVPVSTQVNSVKMQVGNRLRMPSGWEPAQAQLPDKVSSSPKMADLKFEVPPRFNDVAQNEPMRRVAITSEHNKDAFTGGPMSAGETKSSMPYFQQYLDNFSTLDFDAMMNEIKSRPGTTKDQERPAPKLGMPTLPTLSCTLSDMVARAPPNDRRAAPGDARVELPQLPPIKGPADKVTADKMNLTNTSSFTAGSRKPTTAGGTTAQSFFTRSCATTGDSWGPPRGSQTHLQGDKPQNSSLGFLVTDLERQLRDIKREKGGALSPHVPPEKPGLPRPSSKWTRRR